MNASRALVASLTAVGALAVLGASAAAGSGPCASPTLSGTSTDDTLRGGPGPDVIDGRGGDDVLIGLGGDDVLCGGSGQDVLRGGPGADALHGGTDAKVPEDTDYYLYYGDTLDGGPGSDVLDPGSDARHDGSVDEITYDRAAAGVEVDLPGDTVTSTDPAHPDVDTLTGPVSTVTGSPHADTVLGTDRAEVVYGGLGPDRIDGGGGADWLAAGRLDGTPTDRSDNTVIGGPGADVLDDDGGDDLMRGGPGADMLQATRGVDRLLGGPGADGFIDDIEAAAGQVLSGGPGLDRLADLTFYNKRGRYQARVSGVIRMTEGTVVARFGKQRVRVALTSFRDVSTPGGGPWTVHGTAGRDEIMAGYDDYPVRIYSGAGRDRIFGSAKNDVLDGGPGRDTGTGWGGHDRIVSVERIFRN